MAQVTAGSPATAGTAPQQQGKPRPPRPRRPERSTPARAGELVHLSLRELRAYRDELRDEEVLVSYWRRIVQARLDLLAGAKGDERQDLVERLSRALTRGRRESRRDALLRVQPGEAMPPLPNLAELCAEVGQARAADAQGPLAEAEAALSSYRTVLLQRLDLVTADLIARYRDDPAACLLALPVQPGATAR